MNESEFIEQIYRAPLDATPWSGFLDTFRQALSSYSAQLMFSPPCESSGAFNVDVSETYSESVRNLYYQKYCGSNPIRYEEIHAGKLHSMYDFVDRRAFQRTDYYREFCAPNHIDHAFSLYLGESNGLRAWLNLARGVEMGEYTREELALVARLTPHLQQSFQIYANLEKYRSDHDIYLRTIDSMHLATLFLDRYGKIVQASPTARAILASHACIAQSGGRLLLNDSAGNKQFLRMLGELADGKSGSSFVTQATCNCVTEKTTILLRRVDDTSDARFTDRPAVVMHIKKSFQGTHTDMDRISTLFHLSRAEARLALLLSTGSNVDEIAKTLGITNHSVRTYCKRIFAKTGVKRQAELVKLVLDSVAVMVH